MTYQISRDGQEFGPYTLSDVQRYVGTGNILVTDLARAEGTTEWIPVSQVVGTIAVTPPPAAAAYVPAANYPDPPNLHWALVLLFTFLTCGLFYYVWALIQAAWMKRVQPASKALFYYIAGLVSVVVYVIMAFGSRAESGVGLIFRIGGSVLIIVGAFNLRASLEEHYNSVEPVGLSLNGVMTFFFPTIYFQYHINRINAIKQAQRMGAAPNQS